MSTTFTGNNVSSTAPIPPEPRSTNLAEDTSLLLSRQLNAHLAFARLLLVARKPLDVLANEFQLSVSDLDGLNVLDDGDWETYLQAFMSAYGNFVAASRYHLGVDKSLPGSQPANS
ncbi:hypothetical protein CJ178_01805 [Rhodococcus sp. ACPA4]|nr:hypothetical protein CJ178_01805 [Rhodococcus sp. ACPA4]